MKLKEYFLVFIYVLSGLLPKKKEIYVFGAWNGKRFSDNPRYLFEYYRNKNYEVYWIGDKKLLEEIGKTNDKSFLKKNSLRSYKILCQAKYIFISHSFRDISRINIFKNSIKIQLWHGFPIKRIVADVPNDPGRIKLNYEEYDYFLSSSTTEDQRLLTAFRNWNITEDKIIKIGQPRNDILLKNNESRKIQERLKKELLLEEFQKVIIYLPTFRDKSENVFSFLNSFRVDEYLKKNNYVVLERQHFQRREKKQQKNSSHNIRLLDEKIDTQELLILADLLITDFSSVFMDYAILDRPIIHYLYDNDEYIEFHRGIYGEFSEECAGSVVYNEEELIKAISISLKIEEYGREERRRAYKLSNEYNKNNNCKYIEEFLLEKI